MPRTIASSFKTTETLFTLSPLAARKGLPAGWLLRMPIGLQHVSVELHTCGPACWVPIAYGCHRACR